MERTVKTIAGIPRIHEVKQAVIAPVSAHPQFLACIAEVPLMADSIPSTNNGRAMISITATGGPGIMGRASGDRSVISPLPTKAIVSRMKVPNKHAAPDVISRILAVRGIQDLFIAGTSCYLVGLVHSICCSENKSSCIRDRQGTFNSFSIALGTMVPKVGLEPTRESPLNSF